MQKKISIVIAVHNRKEKTIFCLEQLYKQKTEIYKIIVVDDGSTDGTAALIKEKFPTVHIIQGDGNWWWTKSVNEGIKTALGFNTDYILLMNDDTIFNENYIEQFCYYSQNFPNGIIGSLQLTLEEPHRIYFSGVKKINWLTAKYHRYHNTLSYTNLSELKGIHESAILPARGLWVPSLVFEKIGLLDEKKMPQYASDMDFVLRAKANKIPIYISWDVPIYTSISSTGKGDVYKKQSFLQFLRTFFNKYSKRYWKVSLLFYYRHSKPRVFFLMSFFFDKFRIFFAFFRGQMIPKK